MPPIEIPITLQNSDCYQSYSIFLDSSLQDSLPPVVQTMQSERRISRLVWIVDERFSSSSLKSIVPEIPSDIIPLIGDEHTIKTRETKSWIEDQLLSLRCDRNTVLIVLGGGSLGDLVGFTASTYMRGIRFVQIPTTLLAIVDASIGGKTAINTNFAKNSIGSFHQPSAVICDFSYLSTLPEKEWRSGMAEIVKAGFVGDSELYSLLSSRFSGLGQFRSSLLESSDIAIKVVRLAIEYKQRIVTADENDTGIRNELNFGHTIGHALERLSCSSFSHGECVAIGMVYELLCLRAVKFLNCVQDINCLKSVLEKFDLPTFIPPRLLDEVRFDEFKTFIQMDKKSASVDDSQSAMVPIVAIRSRGHAIGKSRTIGVPARIVFRIVAPCVSIKTPVSIKHAAPPRVQLPGSKSIANRALLLAAINGFENFVLSNVPSSVDVQIMIDAINQFGTPLAASQSSADLITVNGPMRIEHPHVSVFVGNSGTTSRFLLPVAAFLISQSGIGQSVTFTCDPRMSDRPIMDLVKAIMSLFNNLRVVFADKKGCFPLTFERTQESAHMGITDRLSIDSSLSSQFVSGLLMMLSFMYPSAVELEVTGLKPNGEATSQPFIDMSLRMIEIFGTSVEKTDNGSYRCLGRLNREDTGISRYSIPGDAAAATYPLAIAAITGTEVAVNIGPDGLQADYRFVNLLEQWGCDVVNEGGWTKVRGPSSLSITENFSINMSDLTDTFLTASVLLAKASESTNSSITDIANQRVKECDRIFAMAFNLNICGYHVEETKDGLWFCKSERTTKNQPLITASYNDHRVAMSMAVLATVVPKILIENPRCVEKTFPNFWDVLESDLGIDLVGVPMPTKTNPFDNTIILIGMRGVGKSTIGSVVASRIDECDVVDTDKVLEEKEGQSADAIILSIGWDKFRQLEFETLKTVLMDSVRTGKRTIVATGGGIVEYEPSRNLIATVRNVVWIKTLNDEETVDRCRAASEKLMSASYDPMEVYDRRKPLYGECSWYNLYTDKMGIEQSGETATDLVKTLWSSSSSSLDFPTFVCLTASSYSGYTESDFVSAIGRSPLVEIRLDKIESLDRFFIDYRRIRALINRPIILTMRTVYEGGSFDGDYLECLQTILRLCPDYVDVEIRDESAVEWIRDNFSNYPNICFIASRHYSTPVPESDLELVSDIQAVMSPYWSVVGKIVYRAKTVSENARLHVCADSQSRIFKKPCVAVCTGPKGILSRVLNCVMTPVCSNDSRVQPAVVGQLSESQIESFRTGQVGSVRKTYHLFGTPIDKSPSPFMHNLMFAIKGLGGECEYTPVSTISIGELVGIVEGSPNFRGASVTIPLKERVFEYCVENNHQLSEDAQLAGAVNTLTKLPSGCIRGDNTDIKALRKILKRTCVQPTSVVVVGTGGAARAAIVAAKSFPYCDPIYVYGRDEDKIETLCSDFSILPWDGGYSNSVVISCVPAMVQEGILENAPNLVTGNTFLIEMAYIPRVTPFAAIAQSVVFGSEILVLQGIEQHQLWIDSMIVEADHTNNKPSLSFLKRPIDPSFIESQIALFSESK